MLLFLAPYCNLLRSRLGHFHPAYKALVFKKKKKPKPRMLLSTEHYLFSGFYYIFFWNSLRLCSATSPCPTGFSPSPISLHTSLFPPPIQASGQNPAGPGTHASGRSLSSFILTGLGKQLPPKTLFPGGPLGHHLSTRVCSIRDSG